MAKKLKKGLNEKKSSIIVTGPFSIDNAKMYIAATLIMFHIIPLLFVFLGRGRQTTPSHNLYVYAKSTVYILR